MYHVLYCSIEKKVTVMFRGTGECRLHILAYRCFFLSSDTLDNSLWLATLKELQVDADGFIVDCDNPLNPESKEKIGVHKGFRGE